MFEHWELWRLSRVQLLRLCVALLRRKYLLQGNREGWEKARATVEFLRMDEGSTNLIYRKVLQAALHLLLDEPPAEVVFSVLSEILGLYRVEFGGE